MPDFFQAHCKGGSTNNPRTLTSLYCWLASTVSKLSLMMLFTSSAEKPACGSGVCVRAFCCCCCCSTAAAVCWPCRVQGRDPYLINIHCIVHAVGGACTQQESCEFDERVGGNSFVGVGGVGSCHKGSIKNGDEMNRRKTRVITSAP